MVEMNQEYGFQGKNNTFKKAHLNVNDASGNTRAENVMARKTCMNKRD